MAAAPTVMGDVKEWLMTKCRDAGTLLTVERQQISHGSKYVNFTNIVVTPENIPPFTIPRSEGLYSPNDRYSPDSEGRSESSDSLTHSSNTSPGHSPCCQRKPTNNHLSPIPSLHTRSAPVSPIKSMEGKCGGSLIKVLSEMDTKHEITNADPLSRTALSLPHLKTKTEFGFETLSESPHTRRKESLFHDENGSPSNKAFKRTTPRRKTTGSMDAINPNIIEVSRSAKPRPNKRRNVPSVIAPLGVVLVPNSHAGEGRLVFPSINTKTQLHPFSSCPEFAFSGSALNKRMTDMSSMATMTSNVVGRRLYRRSSLHEELSNSCLIDQDANLHRRNSNNIHLLPTDVDNIWGQSSCHSSSTDLSSSCSCRSLSKCGLGNLRFSFQYLKKLRQLKVDVIRAENLGGTQKECQDMNTLVKLYMMPGKIQKQATKIVKQTKDPLYNQDFVFHGIEPHQVHGMKLHMKVYQKSSKLAREELLGELQVAMENFELNTEIRLLKALDPPMSKQELGYIYISVCFYASAEKLSVSIHKVTDLTKHLFTGAPDPYVRVELQQPGRSILRSETRTKKKSTSASFDETFTFSISPKIDDIKYTGLDITVMDRGMLRSDGVLGQIKLGYKATEEGEFEHWNQVLQNPGRVITSWHMLMESADF